MKTKWWGKAKVIYDKEFYAVVLYFFNVTTSYTQEFVLYCDHEALRFLNSQKKLDSRHIKWVEYFQDYTFVLRYRSRSQNKDVDVLSRNFFLLTALSVNVVGFEHLREEYEYCPDFGIIYAELAQNSAVIKDGIHLQDDCLFRANKLCARCYLCIISLFGKFLLEVYLAILDGTKPLRRSSTNFASLP